MKKSAFLLLSVLLAVASFGATDRADSILKLLNTRSAASPKAYAAAASAVMEDARRGDILPQYVVAVLSESPDWPAEKRLAPDVREEYLKRSEAHIKALAEEGNKALAWYLVYLRTHEESALQNAVDGGNVQALNAAGTARLKAALGNDGLDADEAESIKRTCHGYFKRAAEAGDANGLNNLGICLQNGFGCGKDEAEAFSCFSKAAQKGHAEAVNNLGRFYREGVCVRRDLAIARRCFQVSAGQGNPSGQLNFALALLRGEGAAADPDRGIALLVNLADAGELEAVDCLFLCYSQGLGAVKPDATKSLYWMFRARAARGDRNAARWVKENDESTHDR